ncbi:MFS transporter [Rhodococcus sp. A14]|uniref:MFS transporter n=1 Tax=Rhodococcus sp. A14 TaxID=1194106 RepID=UPI00141DF26B|nr:MHS family MFS transporter [Rhodococcus sp. A14]
MTAPTTPPARSGHGRGELASGGATPMARKAVFSATLSTALEWFDFAVYGTLAATVFPVVFFPDLTPTVALLASFGTFGAGFLARPLGGVVFGNLGDRIGRRRVLTYTLIVMGTASALIGVLPGYATIGLIAPFLLVLMRFAQGFAAGGEMTGAQLMALEHAPHDRRGFYSSFIAIGSPISQVMATLTLTGLAATLDDHAFTTWGWRIPLVASFLLVIVAVYIRRRVEETPDFTIDREQSGKTERPRALAVFRTHPRIVITLILSWAAAGALFYITTVFSLSYMTRTLGFAKDLTFGLMVAANLTSICAALVGGRFADRIGRRNTLALGLLALAAFSLPLFAIIDTRNIALIAVCIAGCLSSVQFMAAAQPTLFAESFPISMRYTGSAAGYTGANLLFSAPAPFIASWLLTTFDGNTWAITGYTLVLIAISFGALAFLPNRTSDDLEGAHR